MKKMLALFLVLAMALSIMVIPASATSGEADVEPCVEIADTCRKCGGAMVYVRSEFNTYKYPTGGCDKVHNVSHYHEVIDYDNVYSCRSCGYTYCVTTSHTDFCRA